MALLLERVERTVKLFPNSSMDPVFTICSLDSLLSIVAKIYFLLLWVDEYVESLSIFTELVLSTSRMMSAGGLSYISGVTSVITTCLSNCVSLVSSGLR